MVLFVAKVTELCGYLRSRCPTGSEVPYSPLATLLGSQAHSHRPLSLPLASAEISYSLGASPALEVRSCHDVLGLVSTLSWSWRLIPFEHVVA